MKVTKKWKLVSSKRRSAEGTVKGIWYIQKGAKGWIEEIKECKMAPTIHEACNDFSGKMEYGEIESPLWLRKVVSFNKDKIELRSSFLGGDNVMVNKFIRQE